MKYYCKNCGTEYNFKNDSYLISCRARTPNMMMDDDSCDGTLEPIPGYETLEQYEKRTGKAYPDNGLVWYRMYDPKCIHGRWSDWRWGTYGLARQLRISFLEIKSNKSEYLQIVIADPPVPPSDSWRPE